MHLGGKKQNTMQWLKNSEVFQKYPIATQKKNGKLKYQAATQRWVSNTNG